MTNCGVFLQKSEGFFFLKNYCFVVFFFVFHQNVSTITESMQRLGMKGTKAGGEGCKGRAQRVLR